MAADVIDWNDLLHKRRPKRIGPSTATQASPAAGASYAQSAMSREVELVANAVEGTRNPTLNIAAFNLGQLVPNGYLSREEIADNLRAAAEQAGLEPDEIEKTIRSGLAGGELSPRTVAELPEIPVRVTEVSAEDILPGGAEGALEGLEDSPWYEARSIKVASVDAANAPEPRYLWRTDSQALLYAGKVNGLIGESESGKSWIAFLAVAQAVAAGENVVILDFEDSITSVLERLVSLLLDDEQLERVVYLSPLGRLNQDALLAMLDLHRPGLIVLDGVNAAMNTMGLDINSNNDATTFSQDLLKPMAATGACVAAVDHVPKSIEARGKGGIGAQAKRAMIDGAAIRVEVIEPFGRGQTGEMKLTVDKDRLGRVRGIALASRAVGQVHLVSIGDVVELSIEPTSVDSAVAEGDGLWRPTAIMEEVSRYLEEETEPASQTQIGEMVPRKVALVRQATSELVKAGYVERFSGPRVAKLHVSLRPYREGDSLKMPTPSDPVPPRPGRGQSDPVPSSHPFRVGRGQDAVEDVVVSRSTRDGVKDTPEGYSSCNACGVLTPGWVIDDTGGYCTSCKVGR